MEIGLDCHKRFGDSLYRFGSYNEGIIVIAMYSLCCPN